MNMYNLIECSDNYSYFTASLYQFKRQEPLENNADLTVNESSSFRYKSSLLGTSGDGGGGNRIWKNARIIVPLN